MVDKNPLPEVVETSNPVGAVIVRSAVRLLPPTVKLCSADAVPKQDENALNVPVVVIIGFVAIVKLTDAVLVPAAPFNV
jgi:hypothetical protein